MRVLLARTFVQSRPSPLHCRGLQAALSPSRQPGSSLGRRDGWRPEREADSSANSASLDRPSAVLPIVALPRNRRTGHMRGEPFFRNSYIYIYIYISARCRWENLPKTGGHHPHDTNLVIYFNINFIILPKELTLRPLPCQGIFWGGLKELCLGSDPQNKKYLYCR